MDVQSEQENAPRVLLGPAVTRLLRIRSLYYELVAVAVLGFAGISASLFGNLYFVRVWHLTGSHGTAERSDIYSIIGLAAFLGLPVAYTVGDRLFRRAPQAPLVLAGICITVYGTCSRCRCTCPSCGWWWRFQLLANAAVAPIAIAIFQTLAATAPPEMRSICFAMFGVYSAVFGGFAGGIILGAISDASNVTTALTFIGPVCAAGWRAARRRLTLRPTRHHPRDRGRPRALRRGQAASVGRGDPGPADPQHGLLLRDPAGPLRREPGGRRGRHRGAARHQRRGQEHAAAGRGGARPPPSWGHPHLRHQLHLPRARADHRPRRRAARGGEDDVPGPERPGQPAHRGALVPARRPSGQDRPRRRRRPVPRARVPARPAGGHVVGRRAADAGPGPGHDDQAPPAHDRRARLRPGSHDRRAPDGHRPAGERRRGHRDPGRAEREPGHDPGRARLLPRARRGPLRRLDLRAPATATTCCARSSSPAWAPPWATAPRGQRRERGTEAVPATAPAMRGPRQRPGPGAGAAAGNTPVRTNRAQPAGPKPPGRTGGPTRARRHPGRRRGPTACGWAGPTGHAGTRATPDGARGATT